MGACFQAPHAAPGQKPIEMKLVMPPFIFITYQHNFTGGLWSMKLLINILLVAWAVHCMESLTIFDHFVLSPFVFIYDSTPKISQKGEGKRKNNNSILASKVQGVCCNSKLCGCMFPGSLYHTQTETDGIAPCFTNYSFVFQNASLTHHSGMYKINDNT